MSAAAWRGVRLRWFGAKNGRGIDGVGFIYIYNFANKARALQGPRPAGPPYRLLPLPHDLLLVRVSAISLSLPLHEHEANSNSNSGPGRRCPGVAHSSLHPWLWRLLF